MNIQIVVLEIDRTGRGEVSVVHLEDPHLELRLAAETADYLQNLNRTKEMISGAGGLEDLRRTNNDFLSLVALRIDRNSSSSSSSPDSTEVSQNIEISMEATTIMPGQVGV